jgi:uncharacterized protein YndB with AHSA1/START domain
MRRWMTVMALACAVALPLFLILRGSDTNFDGLARSGAIETAAPIKVSLQIVIDAPTEKVWAILTDVDDWPKWQPEIEDAHVAGSLAAGTDFTWTTGGTHIRSTIALVKPVRQIGWTGVAMNARAVHQWTLEPLQGNRTLVKTDESMSGLLLTFFYSSDKLRAADQAWLDFLKLQAEK